MNISFSTIKGMHDFNEDIVGYKKDDNILFAYVIDGATALFKTEKLHDEINALKYELSNLNDLKNLSLKEIIITLINKAAKHVEYDENMEVWQKGSYACAFIKIDSEKIELFSLADCYIEIPRKNFITNDELFQKARLKNRIAIDKLDENDPDYLMNKMRIYQDTRKQLNKQYYALSLYDLSPIENLDIIIMPNDNETIYMYSDGIELLQKENGFNIDCNAVHKLMQYSGVSKDDASILTIDFVSN